MTSTPAGTQAPINTATAAASRQGYMKMQKKKLGCPIHATL
jgi:hypothetical protein